MSAEQAATVEALGPFRLEREALRQPLEGRAYEAVDHGSGARALVTVADISPDPEFARRFLADAARLARADHPCLPRVLESGQSDSLAWVATSCPDGTPLLELAGASGLVPMRAVRVLGDVADALDAAHAEGLLHRALGPETVLVREAAVDRPLLWGFALGSSARQAGQGDLPASPEELRGEPVTGASDRYALAWMLFWALTGSPPHRSAPGVPAVSSARPELPEELDAIMAAGLAEQPADRPASAGELVAATARALVSAPRAASATPRPAKAPPQPAPPPPPLEAPDPDPEPPREEKGEAGRTQVQPARADEVATERTQMETAPPERGAEAQEAASPAAEPAGAAPPTAAKEERPAGRRHLRVALQPAALLLVAIAAAGGLLAGRESAEDPRSAAPARVESGRAGLTLPAGWTQAGTPAGAPLRDALSAVAPDEEGRLSAGVVDGAGGLLFPQNTAERFMRTPRDPQAVAVGPLNGWRFGGRARGAEEDAGLLLLPTTGGTYAVSCSGDSRALAECTRAAGSLRVRGARSLELRPLATYARRADRALDRLAAARRADRGALRRAPLRRTQARVTRRLARSYADAAQALSSGIPRPVRGEVHPLIAGLRSASAAYTSLGIAARRTDRPAYRAAARRVESAEIRAQRAIAAL